MYELVNNERLYNGPCDWFTLICIAAIFIIY